MKHITNLLT